MTADAREDLGYVVPDYAFPKGPEKKPKKPEPPPGPKLTGEQRALLARAEAGDLRVPVPMGWRRTLTALEKLGLVRANATLTPAGAAALAAWRASR